MLIFQNHSCATINASWAARFSITRNHEATIPITGPNSFAENPTSGHSLGFVSEIRARCPAIGTPHERRVLLMTNTGRSDFNRTFTASSIDKFVRTDENATWPVQPIDGKIRQPRDVDNGSTDPPPVPMAKRFRVRSNRLRNLLDVHRPSSPKRVRRFSTSR